MGELDLLVSPGKSSDSKTVMTLTKRFKIRVLNLNVFPVRNVHLIWPGFCIKYFSVPFNSWNEARNYVALSPIFLILNATFTFELRNSCLHGFEYTYL